MAIAYELVVILALILANGVFAGAEIAIVAVRRTRLMELVDSGSAAARSLLELREQPERFLATTQIVITVVTASAAAIGGASLTELLAPQLAKLPWLAPYAGEVALGVVVAAVSFLSIVLGELVPKSLALRAAEPYALLVGRPLRALSTLNRPLVWLLTASSNLVLRPFGDRTTFTEIRHSPEELQQLVAEASRAGTVHPGAGEIASRALDLQDLTAADVMVPRQRVVMIPRHAPMEEVQRILLEHTHTRMPVYDGGVDNIVGYVHVKDLIAFTWEHGLIVLEDVMRPAVFVPETQRGVDLLQEMRRRHNPLVVVVDEQGGMSGIVTMEDLLEELVGEIFSEHVEHVPKPVVREGERSALIVGSTPIREVNRELDLDLPEDGDFTTVAGLTIALAGRIPAPGDKLPLPSGIILEIVDASPKRVRTVRLRRPEQRPPEDAADAPQ